MSDWSCTVSVKGGPYTAALQSTVESTEENVRDARRQAIENKAIVVIDEPDVFMLASSIQGPLREDTVVIVMLYRKT